MGCDPGGPQRRCWGHTLSVRATCEEGSQGLPVSVLQSSCHAADGAGGQDFCPGTCPQKASIPRACPKEPGHPLMSPAESGGYK